MEETFENQKDYVLIHIKSKEIPSYGTCGKKGEWFCTFVKDGVHSTDAPPVVWDKFYPYVPWGFIKKEFWEKLKECFKEERIEKLEFNLLTGEQDSQQIWQKTAYIPKSIEWEESGTFSDYFNESCISNSHALAKKLLDKPNAIIHIFYGTVTEEGHFDILRNACFLEAKKGTHSDDIIVLSNCFEKDFEKYWNNQKEKYNTNKNLL